MGLSLGRSETEVPKGVWVLSDRTIQGLQAYRRYNTDNHGYEVFGIPEPKKFEDRIRVK